MLDVTRPNQLTIATVYIDTATGMIGMQNKVSTDYQPGRVLYCCAGPDYRALGDALACSVNRIRYGGSDVLSIALHVEETAELAGIGVTSHGTVIARALSAVQLVNQTIAEMQCSGGMRDLNCSFKEARRADRSLRYHDYLHRHKALMLEAMAREIGR